MIVGKRVRVHGSVEIISVASDESRIKWGIATICEEKRNGERSEENRSITSKCWAKDG